MARQSPDGHLCCCLSLRLRCLLRAWKRSEIVSLHTLYYAHALTDAAPRPDSHTIESKEDSEHMTQTERPVALVTGGSRGIGAATVLALAARGYDVALTYRNKAARAERVVAQARALGGDALAIGGDMTQPDDLARQLDALRAWRPSLDALVLNASGSGFMSADGYALRVYTIRFRTGDSLSAAAN